MMSPRFWLHQPGLAFLVVVSHLMTVVSPLWGQQPGSDVLLQITPTAAITPIHHPINLKGLVLHPEDPFRLQAILDTGDVSGDDPELLKKESLKLIKYFLAGLTMPHDEMWVNLSPDEPDRIIPERFGRTLLGRDLLVQDYLLKQTVSALLYPKGEVGQRFWEAVYKEAMERYGTTDIPVNTHNRVWITPGKAAVSLVGDVVIVAKARMKVMLEEDYLANKSTSTNETDSLGRELMRRIVLPALEREVNEGERFKALRQMYHALVLAAWFKGHLKQHWLRKGYVGQGKIKGVERDGVLDEEAVYQAYLKAFQNGLYNLIEEERDPMTDQMVLRRYFSGGFISPKSGEVRVVDPHAATPPHGQTVVVEAQLQAFKEQHETINNSVTAVLQSLAERLRIQANEEGKWDFVGAWERADDSQREDFMAKGFSVIEMDVGGQLVNVVRIKAKGLPAHTGLGAYQWAIYGETDDQLEHERAELAYWLNEGLAELKKHGFEYDLFAQNKTMSLRETLVTWATDETVSDEVRLKRQRVIAVVAEKAHKAGLRAQAKYVTSTTERRRLEQELEEYRVSLPTKPLTRSQLDLLVAGDGGRKPSSGFKPINQEDFIGAGIDWETVTEEQWKRWRMEAELRIEGLVLYIKNHDLLDEETVDSLKQIFVFVPFGRAAKKFKGGLVEKQDYEGRRQIFLVLPSQDFSQFRLGQWAHFVWLLVERNIRLNQGIVNISQEAIRINKERFLKWMAAGFHPNRLIINIEANDEVILQRRMKNVLYLYHPDRFEQYMRINKTIGERFLQLEDSHKTNLLDLINKLTKEASAMTPRERTVFDFDHNFQNTKLPFLSPRQAALVYSLEGDRMRQIELHDLLIKLAKLDPELERMIVDYESAVHPMFDYMELLGMSRQHFYYPLLKKHRNEIWRELFKSVVQKDNEGTFSIKLNALIQAYEKKYHEIFSPEKIMKDVFLIITGYVFTNAGSNQIPETIQLVIEGHLKNIDALIRNVLLLPERGSIQKNIYSQIQYDAQQNETRVLLHTRSIALTIGQTISSAIDKEITKIYKESERNFEGQSLKIVGIQPRSVVVSRLSHLATSLSLPASHLLLQAVVYDFFYDKGFEPSRVHGSMNHQEKWVMMTDIYVSVKSMPLPYLEDYFEQKEYQQEWTMFKKKFETGELGVIIQLPQQDALWTFQEALRLYLINSFMDTLEGSSLSGIGFDLSKINQNDREKVLEMFTRLFGHPQALWHQLEKSPYIPLMDAKAQGPVSKITLTSLDIVIYKQRFKRRLDMSFTLPQLKLGTLQQRMKSMLPSPNDVKLLAAGIDFLARQRINQQEEAKTSKGLNKILSSYSKVADRIDYWLVDRYAKEWEMILKQPFVKEEEGTGMLVIDLSSLTNYLNVPPNYVLWLIFGLLELEKIVQEKSAITFSQLRISIPKRQPLLEVVEHFLKNYLEEQSWSMEDTKNTYNIEIMDWDQKLDERISTYLKIAKENPLTEEWLNVVLRDEVRNDRYIGEFWQRVAHAVFLFKLKKWPADETWNTWGEREAPKDSDEDFGARHEGPAVFGAIDRLKRRLRSDNVRPLALNKIVQELIASLGLTLFDEPESALEGIYLVNLPRRVFERASFYIGGMHGKRILPVLKHEWPIILPNFRFADKETITWKALGDLLHEVYERELMRLGLPDKKAHELVSSINRVLDAHETPVSANDYKIRADLENALSFLNGFIGFLRATQEAGLATEDRQLLASWALALKQSDASAFDFSYADEIITPWQVKDLLAFADQLRKNQIPEDFQQNLIQQVMAWYGVIHQSESAQTSSSHQDIIIERLLRLTQPGSTTRAALESFAAGITEASRPSSSDAAPGGVDFNPDRIQWTNDSLSPLPTKGVRGEEIIPFETPTDPESLEGLVPVLIDIRPISWTILLSEGRLDDAPTTPSLSKATM